MEIVTFLLFLLVTVYFIWSSTFSYGKNAGCYKESFYQDLHRYRIPA